MIAHESGGSHLTLVMSTEYERNCTVFVASDKTQLLSIDDIKRNLMSRDDKEKARAIEHVLLNIFAGNNMNPLLMQVVQHCLHSNDKHIKRLTQIFWEIIDKTDADGKPKEELIMICEYLRSELTHANEYVRGSTLRTLCKIPSYMVIEPLVDVIFENLHHRHGYVRRNAVMCIYSLYENFDLDVSGAIEEMENLLTVGSDLQAKRNALLFLGAVAPEKAISFVLDVAEARVGEDEDGGEDDGDVEVSEEKAVVSDTMDLAILSLARRACADHPEHRSALLKEVLALSQDRRHPSVAFEGCNALMALTANKQAVHSAIRSYLRLLDSQSDNNVRMIVLERLAALLTTQASVLETYLEDILRSLAVPNIAVRKRVLEIALRVVTKSSVGVFVTSLKKHLLETTKGGDALAKQDASNVEFRRLLARCMHLACSMHPEAASGVVHVLLDLLGETDGTTSSEVVLMIRELVCRASLLRDAILTRIVAGLGELHHAVVMRVALFLLGEFTAIEDQARTPEGDAKAIEALTALVQAVGTAPFLPTSGELGNNANVDVREVKVELTLNKKGSKAETQPALATASSHGGKGMIAQTRTVVLPDGTYGTETYYVDANTAAAAEAAAEAEKTPEKEEDKPKGTVPHSPLRKLVQMGDWLVVSVLAQTLAQLAVRATSSPSALPAALVNEVTLVLANLAKFARDDKSAGPNSDACLRVTQALRSVLADSKTPNGSKAERRKFEELSATARKRLLDVLDTQADSTHDELDEAVKSKSTSAAPARLLPNGNFDKSAVPAATVVKTSAASGVSFRQLDVNGDSTTRGAVDESSDIFASTAGKKTSALGLLGGSKLKLGSTASANDSANAAFLKKLSKVQQMTGCADPVYVEAVLQVEDFAGTVELLVVNRTAETLTNVTIELLTSNNDLRVVDRPAPFSLAPFDSKTVHATLHVSSTEAGSLFGYVTFTHRQNASLGVPFLKDSKPQATEDASATTQVLSLDKITIDLLDMLRRAWTTEPAFRQMWVDFEWENRIEVSTPSQDAHGFLLKILEGSNLSVVKHGESQAHFAEVLKTALQTGSKKSAQASSSSSLQSTSLSPEELETQVYLRHASSLPELQRLKEGASAFFSINLYGKSIFGEDVIANLSLRKATPAAAGEGTPAATPAVAEGIEGTVRIRARSRGIAISLGDRISLLNKHANSSASATPQNSL